MELTTTALIPAISGVVRSSSASAVPYAKVTLSHHTGPGGSFTASSDKSGRFTMRWLPRGVFHVTCEAETYARVSVPDFKVEETSSLTISMPRAATIVGQVLIPKGLSLPSLTFVITQPPDGDWHVLARQGLTQTFAHPGSDGRFKLTNLAPGKYTLYLSHQGKVRDRVTAEVREGDTVTAPWLEWRNKSQ